MSPYLMFQQHAETLWKQNKRIFQSFYLNALKIQATEQIMVSQKNSMEALGNYAKAWCKIWTSQQIILEDVLQSAL